MKKTRKKAKKLALKKETVRTLSDKVLKHVAGGNVGVLTQTLDTARCQITPKTF